MSTANQKIDDYNNALKNYQSQTDTIFSSKNSELLGKDNPVILQMKGIAEERLAKIEANKVTPLQLHKDRLFQEQQILKQQQDAGNHLLDSDIQLQNYINNKSAKNGELINTLQDSIYTRDKTIYLNNKDANDKHVLIKTLLTVLLLAITLATISYLHMFGLISNTTTLVVSVLVTVIFVYKIIRTYYWSQAVHDMDIASDTVSASLRAVLGEKDCPMCDTSDYCTAYLKKKNRTIPNYCINNRHDACCQHDSTNTVRPSQPHDLAIIDGNTDINLL